MAEITFKSAGVKTREIDLSQPSRSGPVGIPAGIIGTSLEGPAFVPLTFANFSDFVTTFGESDAKKFGPIAVSQWLANAQAVTYMRVLGAGDGKKRNTTTGKVTNAGFTVGNRIPQANGNINNNAFATAGTQGNSAPEGRAYFLGCFMSESNGSTIFSEAGIQAHAVENQAVGSISLVVHATGSVALTDSTGLTKTYHFHSGASNAADLGSNRVLVKSNGVTVNNLANNFKSAINAATGHNGSIQAEKNAAGGLTHFTQSLGGVFGNTGITYAAPTTQD